MRRKEKKRRSVPDVDLVFNYMVRLERMDDETIYLGVYAGKRALQYMIRSGSPIEVLPYPSSVREAKMLVTDNNAKERKR